ncbi:L-rhamnose-proton symporter [Edaphobacter acidisoli]|uniref:L-rhamnose-proton symporter n=2 Tax=Edaphobacter acidisoli TaxID=2040573 RepID=A0A916RUY8_9BACT|nr:L-rhamnose-proton symporter [Edaphobacter acidisoli]
MWAVFSLVSLVILPWGLAFCFVHNLHAIYSSLPLPVFFMPVLFGACWGVAQILFGISVDRLGMSLTYAIVVGMGAALGTLVPMIALEKSELHRRTVEAVVLGIVLMALGIVLTTLAGRLRDNAHAALPSHGGKSYRALILLAVLCGFLAPMLNYSFAFGQQIAKQSIVFGNSPALASYAVWPIGLAGGFIPNAGYAAYLILRRRSLPLFAKASPDIWLASAMAVLWMGAFAVYGMSAAFLGNLGTSIGWALFQIFMIVAASVSGLLTGEWKNASGRAFAYLISGMSLLIAATIFLTFTNRT